MTYPDNATTHILVFKTNIASAQDVLTIAPSLDADPTIEKWNIDHDDADHILRIESTHQDLSYFIRIVNENGFYCQELPD